MLRSVPPAVVLGAVAVLSFGVGVALEPMFERPAHADMPIRAAKLPKPAAKPAKIEVAPAPGATAGKAVEASMTPSEPAPEPAVKAGDAPQTSDGAASADVELDLADMPEQQGLGLIDPGRDVDMIDNGFDAGEASATAVPVPEAAPAATDPSAQN